MKEFIAPEWLNILEKNKLADFDALWNLELKLLDKPNVGRGRDIWSKVCCLSVQLPEGEEKQLILKRQKNYNSRTFLHPFRGIPTFEKEAKHALRLKKLGIPVMELVYFKKRWNGVGVEAVLLTEYLDGYTSFDKLLNRWQEEGWPKGVERNKVVEAIARLVHNLHSKGVKHNNLYHKHILIRIIENRVKTRLIDLEKCKKRPFGRTRILRDLETLNRKTEGLSRQDHFRFLKTYLGIKRLNKYSQQLCFDVERHRKTPEQRGSRKYLKELIKRYIRKR